jgi:hypothetical protein
MPLPSLILENVPPAVRVRCLVVGPSRIRNEHAADPRAAHCVPWVINYGHRSDGSRDPVDTVNNRTG